MLLNILQCTDRSPDNYPTRNVNSCKDEQPCPRVSQGPILAPTGNLRADRDHQKA